MSERMHESIAYWVRAAREQSSLYVQYRKLYRQERHAHKRAMLWEDGNRCRERIPHFMAEARRMRAEVARVRWMV